MQVFLILTGLFLGSTFLIYSLFDSQKKWLPPLLSFTFFVATAFGSVNAENNFCLREAGAWVCTTYGGLDLETVSIAIAMSFFTIMMFGLRIVENFGSPKAEQ